LFTLEVHVFAFAIAANVLLCFFPFTVLLLSLCRNVLRYQPAYDGVLEVLRDALPSNQPFIIRNLEVLVQGHRKAQIWLFVLLLFSSNGVLLPLEMALNNIWGLKNRNYLANQAVALLLTCACGCLAFLSMLITGANRAFITGLLGTSEVALLLSKITMKIIALPVTISVFFILYYFLPHGKVPAAPMLRAAIFAGLLTEAAKYLYIWSLPYLNFQEAYGPFYVSVTLLLWGFLASLILLVGAYATAVPAQQEAVI
jgi:YihY family inner membrane protein